MFVRASLAALALLAIAPTQRVASAEDTWVGFPKGFKWCTATSAHQIEGYNSNSDWWAWEQIPGKIKHGDKSGPATDHWNRVNEDIALQKSLGLNQYRLSIEWAKVEPSQGKFDKSVIDHYRKELKALRSAGIEPLVTLHHFTFPIWASEKGGWEWDGVADAFQRYSDYVYNEVGADVRDWVTVNEPLVLLTVGYTDGLFPPGYKRTMQELEKPMTGLLQSHLQAYHAMKKSAAAKGKSIRIGMAHHLRVYDPINWLNPLNHWGAGLLDQAGNWALVEAMETGVMKVDVPFMVKIEKTLPGLKGTQDFVGINYYTRDMVEVDLFGPNKVIRKPNPGAPASDLGWEIFPEGMYRLVKEAAKRFPGKPIMITENGLADAADSRRREYLESHLQQLARAISEGAPVEGYCHWSLLDNFEWHEGFEPRFGLFEVDYKTFKRTARPSAERYAEIISKNGFHAKK